MEYKSEKLNITIRNSEWFKIVETKDCVKLFDGTLKRYAVYANSVVEAWSKASVMVVCNSMIAAFHNSNVVACDNSSVLAYNKSRVEVRDFSCVWVLSLDCDIVKLSKFATNKGIK